MNRYLPERYLRKEQGMRNPADYLYDPAEDTVEDAQLNFLREEFAQKTIAIHVKQEISREQLRLIIATAEACEKISAKLQEVFWKEFEILEATVRPAAEKMKTYIKENNLDRCAFEIFSQKEAQVKLNEWEVNQTIEPGAFVLVFRFPKPLDEWWWKGSANVGGTAIAWHTIRNKIKEIFFAQIYHLFQNANLSIARINDTEQHKVGEYYYLYEVMSKLKPVHPQGSDIEIYPKPPSAWG